MNWTYGAAAERVGLWWMIRIPEIDGLTQARRLEHAAKEAREYIAVTTGVPIDDVKVAVTVIKIGELDIAAENKAVIAARLQASAAESAATDRAARLAHDLSANHLTVREIGAVMGVSHQRAQQLLHR